jgi:Flp pilus assembly protein TadD
MFGGVGRVRRLVVPMALLIGSALVLGACQTKTANLTDADGLNTGSMTGSNGSASFTRTKELGDKWQKDQSNVALGLAYGDNLAKIGQPEQQMTVLKTLAAANPDNAKLQGQLGKKLLGSGKTGEALLALDRAVALGDTDWKTYSALGSAYDQQSKYKEARGLYEKALALSPNEVSVMNNLGMSYALEGNLKEAERILQQANELPGAAALPRVRQNLALVVGLQGRFEESRSIASKDLPPAQVEANMAYLQKMLSQPNTWQQLSDDPQG